MRSDALYCMDVPNGVTTSYTNSHGSTWMATSSAVRARQHCAAGDCDRHERRWLARGACGRQRPPRTISHAAGSAWYTQYRACGVRHLRGESVETGSFSLAETDNPGTPVRVCISDPHQLASRVARLVRAAPPIDPMLPRWYALHLRSQSLRAPASFDTLLAPRVLYDRLRPHPYQLQVVQQVLREKAPAAILADEVGLGKTIEAGLIYKELALRGAVQSALVLAPKALLSQWQEELRERFDEDFVLTDEKRFRGFDREPCVICSLPQFVRSFGKI